MKTFGQSKNETFIEFEWDKSQDWSYQEGELTDAIKDKDLIEVADALTDILYVTYGTGHAFGINLDKCFEVQKSNMSS